MRLSVVVLLAGCGRLQFDELAAVASDATADAARPCVVPDTAPPTVAISGQTFEYTSFDNNRTAVGSVVVTALDPATTMPLGNVTSGAGRAYVVDVPTGGAPRPLAMRYGKAGYFTTTVFSDVPITENKTGHGQPVWTVGDAPIWSDANMMATYTASGVTTQVAAGTLNVAVRDCSGAVVEGVSVSIMPMPGKLVYQAIDGRPSMTLTATVCRSGTHSRSMRRRV